MTFGAFYLLFLAAAALFFGAKSQTLKDRYLANFADRIDGLAYTSSSLIVMLAFASLAGLVVRLFFGVS